jgi:hypothetical protein
METQHVFRSGQMYFALLPESLANSIMQTQRLSTFHTSGAVIAEPSLAAEVKKDMHMD